MQYSCTKKSTTKCIKSAIDKKIFTIKINILLLKTFVIGLMYDTNAIKTYVLMNSCVLT